MKVHDKLTVNCDECNQDFSKRSLKTHKKRMHETLKNSKARTGPYKARKEYSRRQLYRIGKAYGSINKDELLTEGARKSVCKKVLSEFEDTFKNLLEMKQIDEEDLIQMIKNASLTDRQALTILSCLRDKWGNKIITKGVREVLVKRKRIFDSFFEREYVDFVDKEEQSPELWSFAKILLNL